MTNRVQWETTPPTPVQHVLQVRSWIRAEPYETRDATLADLRAALASLSPADRAAVVGADGVAAGCSRCPYCATVRKNDELAEHVTRHCPSNPLRAELKTAWREKDEARESYALASGTIDELRLLLVNAESDRDSAVSAKRALNGILASEQQQSASLRSELERVEVQRKNYMDRAAFAENELDRLVNGMGETFVDECLTDDDEEPDLKTAVDVAFRFFDELRKVRSDLETAERERDEARVDATEVAMLRTLHPRGGWAAEIDRLRSDLERTAKERDEAREAACSLHGADPRNVANIIAVVEAAKAWRASPLSGVPVPNEYALIHAVDALTAPAAEATKAEPPPDPNEREVRALGESSPDDIRAAGWTVAVHNDYRLHGDRFTFWLFTKDGRCVKGEGKTDAEALAEVRSAVASRVRAKDGRGKS